MLCAWQNKCLGGEKNISSTGGMKGLEKQCGIRLCEICRVGSSLARRASKRRLVTPFTTMVMLGEEYFHNPRVV